jgi:hypothetical protein
VRALAVEELRKRPGDVPFRAPDEPLLGEPLERAVGDRARTPKRVELVLVLDCAQPLDETAARHRLDRTRLERLPARVRHVVGLEADPAGEPVCEIPQQRARRLLELDAGDCARRLGIAKVGEEPHAVRLDQQRGVRALEAGQVAHAYGVRYEQRLLERRAQPLDAGVHAPRRFATINSSASR